MVICSKSSAVQKNGKLRKGYTSKEVISKSGKKRTMYFDMKPRGKGKPKKELEPEPETEPEPE